jgi:DinB family protein
MSDDLLERLRTAGEDFEATRATVEAGSPWPLAATFDTSDEADWGPPEVLAHVAEMGPFWLGEIERVVAGGPGPVAFGRVATDTLRLGVLERDRSLPARELYDRTSSALDRLARRWPTLSAADLERVGLHPRLGEMTVAAIADRFIVSHVEEHARQLREVLERPTRRS